MAERISGGLGSIAGVLIADYWLVRDKKLALGDLYRTKGVYAYTQGWNWRAVVATLIGCGLAWITSSFHSSNSFMITAGLSASARRL